MTRLTEKENYLKVIRGEQPDWVPRYTFGADNTGRTPPLCVLGPSLLLDHLRLPGETKDIWGVPQVPGEAAGGAKIPKPGVFILDDIRKWRDVIKAPDISNIDWETMAKKDYEMAGIDRTQTAISFDLHVGYFQNLMAFMGFSEGLCAMYEEPEEVQALMEYLCDFYVEVGEKCIDYYKPDLITICDDTATWKNPFFSVEMYRELIKPSHARQANIGVRRGLPAEMHNCGRCEDFIDDWREFGVVSWNPAQTSNDLDGIKKKYGNSLVINGGYDLTEDVLDPNATEETVKDSVYRTIDRLAGGGGYAFCGGILSAEGDEIAAKKNRWILEAVEEYGATFYQKH